jgi:hypothetical protein
MNRGVLQTFVRRSVFVCAAGLLTGPAVVHAQSAPDAPAAQPQVPATVVAQATVLAQSTPAPAAKGPCDPYKNYECLDDYLGTGFWNRLINYYTLEWGQPAGPSDPKAPEPRRKDYPPAAQSTPPMPFTEWPYGGATSLGVTRPNSIDSPLMTAISDTSFGKWLSDNNIQIYGWFNVGGNISTSSQKPGGNFPAAYMYTPNTVTLDQAVLYVDKFPDTVQNDHFDWGFRLSALYGENYRYTTSFGLVSNQLLDHNKVYGYDFPMLYLDLWIPKIAEGMIVRFGRFISLPDIEAQLAPNNYMYSHSMTYGYDNYTNTGIQTTTAITKNWMIQLGVTVGTEASLPHLTARENNPYPQIPGAGPGQFGYNPLFPYSTFKTDPGAMPSYTGCFRYTSDNGKDDLNVCADAINRGTYGYNNLQWYGATAYHTFNDNWHLSWEGYRITLKGVPNVNNPDVQTIYANGGSPLSSFFIPFNSPNMAQCSDVTALTCNAGVWTTTAYLNYSPDPLNNFSLRPEFFWDQQGQRTGVKTRYVNLAFGWQHWLSPQIELRPEIAYYHSLDGPAFNANLNPNNFMAPTKNSETILSADIIWHF